MSSNALTNRQKNWPHKWQRFANVRRVWPLVLVQCSTLAFLAIQPHLAFILGIHFASGRVLRLQSLRGFSVQFWLNVFKGHCVYVAKKEHSAPGLKRDKTIGSLSQGCHASAQDLSWGETGAAEKGINPQKVNRSIPSPTRLLIFSAPITLFEDSIWNWIVDHKPKALSIPGESACRLLRYRFPCAMFSSRLTVFIFHGHLCRWHTDCLRVQNICDRYNFFEGYRRNILLDFMNWKPFVHFAVSATVIPGYC